MPGCWSQGQTEEEALENIKDAIETYLATVEELSKDKESRYVEVVCMPMRKTTAGNFNKRFGDRISMVFLEKPLSPAEQKVQNNALYKAIKEVMTGILGREPTEAELLGVEDISVHKRRKRERRTCKR